MVAKEFSPNVIDLTELLLAEPVNEHQTHSTQLILNLVGAWSPGVPPTATVIAGEIHKIGSPSKIDIRSLQPFNLIHACHQKLRN